MLNYTFMTNYKCIMKKSMLLQVIYIYMSCAACDIPPESPPVYCTDTGTRNAALVLTQP